MKHILAADLKTLTLYVHAELGIKAAIAAKKNAAPVAVGIYAVPMQRMFAPKGTLRELNNWARRVAEFNAHQRGKLGQPIAGLIRVI